MQREEGGKGSGGGYRPTHRPLFSCFTRRSKGRHREALGLLSTEERCVAREKGQGW